MVSEMNPVTESTHCSNAAVSIYGSPEEVRAAISRLRECGFDLKNLSVIGRDTHSEGQVFGYYNGGDGPVRYWGKSGEFWSAVWSTLSGWAFFTVPGIGPVLVAGPLGGWIASTLDNAAIFGGLSALGAGLYSIGISKRSILVCEAALRADRYVLVAHGAAAEVANAKQALHDSGGLQVTA
jgi:hypothetical protein